MYFEDFDLARRISLTSKVIYYPLVEVYHEAQREHKKNLKLLFHLISSAIKYFFKFKIPKKPTGILKFLLLFTGLYITSDFFCSSPYLMLIQILTGLVFIFMLSLIDLKAIKKLILTSK